MKSVRFYFDYLSPYAYLAWKGIHALCERHDREVEPVPVLLAALLDAHGQKGPAEIPAKRVYVFKNVYRIAHALGLAFEPPPAHPYNPLLPLRVSSLPMPFAARRALIDGLFAAAWGGAGDVTDPGVVFAIAERAGLDGARALRDAQETDAKDRLREQTSKAIAAGVFGVPTVIADGELFWGFDSFAHLDRFLAGDDPIDRELLARWSQLRAAATRRSATSR